MIRNILFQAAYWLISILFALTAVPLLVLPSRRPLMGWIRQYTKSMVRALHHIAGVRVEIRGRDNIPTGPAIIAAKHQSWGDGIIMFSEFHDLAFVTGNHLEKLPLLGPILRKMGAIIVDNCGGAYARARLLDKELKRAKEEDRAILIYPEGHLSKVGTRHPYKKGVFHMYTAYDRPCVPVATNLGLFWPEQSWRLKPGTAIVEFLPPIVPGMEKSAFMARLEETIEARSLALLPASLPGGAATGLSPQGVEPVQAEAA